MISGNLLYIIAMYSVIFK